MGICHRLENPTPLLFHLGAGKCIDFLDRMACFAKLNKKNKKVDIELYRANVALLTCATPLVGRSYDYDDVFPGKQYGSNAAMSTKI